MQFLLKDSQDKNFECKEAESVRIMVELITTVNLFIHFEFMGNHNNLRVRVHFKPRFVSFVFLHFESNESRPSLRKHLLKQWKLMFRFRLCILQFNYSIIHILNLHPLVKHPMLLQSHLYDSVLFTSTFREVSWIVLYTMFSLCKIHIGINQWRILLFGSLETHILKC